MESACKLKSVIGSFGLGLGLETFSRLYVGFSLVS